VRRPLIQRCYVCEHRYSTVRHGRTQLQAEGRDGRPVERPVAGHPDCLTRLAAFDPFTTETDQWAAALTKEQTR
jgi:hypothetical protein